MKIIKTINRLKKELKKAREKHALIGFVPTMGALHQGHLSLIRKSAEETDLTIISIFVNPLQFGPNEDFKKYPRTFRNDVKLAQISGTDIIFAPSTNEMYQDNATFVDMTGLNNKLCGKSRPGHFRGVLTIVNKLFNIIQPNIAYFGQKDFQQAQVIKQMVKDLNMNLFIKVMPTVRAADGLALSSRNKYLTRQGRLYAPRLYQSLLQAKKLIKNGEKNTSIIIRAIKNNMKPIPGARIDYIKVINPATLEKESLAKNKKALIAIAIYIGKTRLIDNILC